MSDEVFPIDFTHVSPSGTLTLLVDDGSQAAYVLLADIANYVAQNFPVSGDLSGVAGNAEVVRISTVPVSLTQMQPGDVLTFNGTEFVNHALSLPTQVTMLPLQGDLTGTTASSEVSKLQTYTLTISNPASGQALLFDGIKFVNGNVPLPAPVTSVGVGGDLTGLSDNAAVVKLQGTQISLSSLAAGQALIFDGTKFVNAIPSVASANVVVTVTGDVTGNTGNTRLAELQSIPLDVSAPSAGQSLIYDGTKFTNGTPTVQATGTASVTGAIDGGYF